MIITILLLLKWLLLDIGKRIFIQLHFMDTNTSSRIFYLKRFIGQKIGGNISPVAKWLEGELVEVDESNLTMQFVVRADMCNPMEILHGGIGATILDDVVGTLVFALGSEYAYTTINLNCDYLHPAKVGEVIRAQATVIRAGRNIVHVEGKIFGQDNKILVKCTSNLIQTNLKLF
jgi:acyl-coenzyme A thioesterase 13